MCLGTMASSSFALFAVLWLVLLVVVQATKCPHCNGGIPSCVWITSNKCPAVDMVAANSAVVAAGTGVLALAGLLKPRFMRIFSLISFETILNLVKRCLANVSRPTRLSVRRAAVRPSRGCP